MRTPETEPAPFACGDRVTYRPRPAGVETVELVRYHHQGWPGWYVRTRREVGPTDTNAHRYDRAELFGPAGTSTTITMPIAVSRFRRLAQRAGCAALFVLILAVVYGVNAVAP
jgi:hypothetical protein